MAMIFVLVTDEESARMNEGKNVYYTLQPVIEQIIKIEDANLEDDSKRYLLCTTQVIALSNNLLNAGWHVYLDLKGKPPVRIEYGMELANGKKLERHDDIRTMYLLGAFGDWQS